MATRCPLASGKLVGACDSCRDSIAHRSQNFLGALNAFFSRKACVNQRQLDVVQRTGARQQLNVWNTKPISLLRMRANSSSSNSTDQLPVQPIVAFAGRVQGSQSSSSAWICRNLKGP